mgnify:CR=1 FL=1
MDEVIDMNSVKIPQGEEKVTIELSLKEAIALTGVKFHEQPELATIARRKVKETIESKVLKH